MARYECPACGGGFPKHGDCPWCGEAMDAGDDEPETPRVPTDSFDPANPPILRSRDKSLSNRDVFRPEISTIELTNQLRGDSRFGGDGE